MAEFGVDELKRAHAAFSRGQLEESRRLCAAILARRAQWPEALHLSAAIALYAGELDSALAQVSQAISARPGDASYHQTRAHVLRQLGRAAEAEADFRQALVLAPRLAEAQAGLAACLLDRGDTTSAREQFAAAVAARPDNSAWRYNLALCDLQAGDADAAESQLREALRLAPGWPQATNLLAAAQMQKGDHDAAAASLEKVLSAQPNQASSWSNLGTVRLAQGRVGEALDCLRKAITLDPRDAQALANLGNGLRTAGDRDGAERAYREALAVSPRHAIAWQNLGNLLREKGRIAESRAALERAVESSGSPQAHFSLAITLLAADELSAAWKEYGWRNGARPRLEAANELLTATQSGAPIVLVSEQGLGDMLFFLRWAPSIDSSHRVWRGEARLAGLLERTGIFQRTEPQGLVAGHEIPIGDLPTLLADRAPLHPPPLPLKADPAALEAARRSLGEFGPPPYVGVAWRSGTASQGGEERLSKNAPIERLATALAATNATLVSLQRKPLAGEHDRFAAACGRPVFDASAWNEDIEQATAALALLSRYVGVSSTNLHIAAGLGVAASVLVPQPPEWRFGIEGSSTPWFPGYSIHRQSPDGGWDAAFEGLGRELAAA